MYTLHTSQGLKFYCYEILQQAKIENYEGIQFYNKLKTEIYKKLKPITYPKNATSFLIEKNMQCAYCKSLNLFSRVQFQNSGSSERLGPWSRALVLLQMPFSGCSLSSLHHFWSALCLPRLQCRHLDAPPLFHICVNEAFFSPYNDIG